MSGFPTGGALDNLGGATLGRGTPYAAGLPVGETTCEDPDDFTVDFNDRGLDGNETDGTDWGEDDGAPKCGASYAADGAWFVWVR